MRRAPHYSLILALALGLAGCAESDRPAEVVIRDSAGIRVVHSPGPQWDPAKRLSLAGSPTLVIGGRDAEGPYTLFRVSAARRLPDGTILVAQSVPPRLSLFDTSGVYLRSFGGAGDGPGEFRVLLRVCLRGDTIVGYDPGHGRFTAFTRDGQLAGVRTVTPAIGESFISNAGVPVWFSPFGDCDFAGRPNAIVPEGPGRARITFSHLDYDDLTVREIVTVEAGEYEADPRAYGGVRSVTFSSIAWAVAGDSTLIVSDAATFTFDEFNRDGRHVRRFSRAHDPVPVTTAEIDAYETWEIESALPGRLEGIRHAQDQAAYADFFPAHDGTMRVSSTGHLWVRHYRRPWVEASTDLWSVFDPRGVFLGEVTTPATFQLSEIGEDYVLGVWRDALDVESVRMFTLEESTN